jgi:Pentapeptide repeats (8 copies)
MGHATTTGTGRLPPGPLAAAETDPAARGALMDSTRFDHLTRLLGGASGRRALLRALLGAALGGAEPASAKKQEPGQRQGHGQSTGQGKDRSQATDSSADQDQSQRKPSQDPSATKNEQGQDHGQGRQSKKPHGGGSGSTPCCGTASCAAPKPGALRKGCAYGSQDFSGADLRGAQFPQIDGRGSTWTGADLRGAHFIEACLQGTRFRRADLRGALFTKACLFTADFTGARLDSADATFAQARFCGTTMPDGSLNNRDCHKPTRCCQSEAEPGPSCQRNADCDAALCALLPCMTAVCQGGNCVCAAVVDGPDPSGECAAQGPASGHCCEGACCLPGASECNPSGLCCAPNCTGRECGPDGCGSGGTCGPNQGACPAGAQCGTDGQCHGTRRCTPQTCPTGCCDANNVCRSGSTDAICGRGGAPCVRCQAGQLCCATPSCGQFLGTCVCSGDSCPDGCCENFTTCRPGTTNQFCGMDGLECLTCDVSEGQVCAEIGSGEDAERVCICTPQTCPNGCCDGGPGNPGVCRANRAPLCGIHGALCQDCFDQGQCNAQGQCVCTPDCTGKTCGGDGCGGSCGTCRTGETCTPQGQCTCTANSCPTGQRCATGRCICDAQSCPTGCCDGGPGNAGACQTGTSDAFCGAGGGACVACPGGTTCTSQRQCVCSPGSCPIGQTCRHGGCFRTCTTDAPCQACGGAGCQCGGQEDLCLDATTSIGVCDNDDDCPLGTLCSGFENDAGQRLCAQPCPGCRACTPGNCPNGQTCVHGGCFLACSTDAPCQACGGAGCQCGNEEELCLDATTSIGVCNNDDDCPLGTLCSFFVNNDSQRLCTQPCPGCGTP